MNTEPTTATKVKRYALATDRGTYQEQADGPAVLHSDYAALEAELRLWMQIAKDHEAELQRLRDKTAYREACFRWTLRNRAALNPQEKQK
jgi:hypothetical protein